MPVEQIDEDGKIVISDILSPFLIENQWNNEKYTLLQTKIYENYHSLALSINDIPLSYKFIENTDISMKDKNQFLHLEPTEDKTIFPVITIQSTEKWLHFRIYALLIMFDCDSSLQTLAIRFETDEGDGQKGSAIGSHDFCHAQFCKSLTSKIRATTPKWIPDSQPSFPLDAEDQISLVLCMLTSIYGGAHVLRKLNESGVRIRLQSYINKVRALRPR